MKASNTTRACTTRAASLFHRLTFLLGIALLPALAFGQIDLTTAGSSGSWGGALFEQGAGDLSSGTGIFDPFYRIKESSTDSVRGVNTDIEGGSTEQFQTEGNAQWTTSLLLSTVTQAYVSGILYREFFLDINQIKNGPAYEITELEVWTDNQPGLDCYQPGYNALGSWGSCDDDTTAVKDYRLDDAGDTKILLLYDLEAGSGNRDMRLLVPDSYFTLKEGDTNCDYGRPLSECSTYVYLYSVFYDNNDGFEEWSTSVQPFVQISKTIEGSLDDSVSWDITKSVSPDSLDLFAGDSADVKYTVNLNKTNTLGSFLITGEIALSVPDLLPDGDENAISASVEALVDTLNNIPITDISCVGDVNGVPPFVIDPGETTVCSYSYEPGSGITGENLAVAWIRNREDTDNVPFMATATLAGYDTTATGEPDTVNVSDLLDGGGLLTFGPYDDDAEFSYNRTFACDADEGNRQNIASIDETTDADTANVDVDCWELSVLKSVETSKVRYYTWELDKSVDPDSLNLFQGDSANTEFTFDVTRTGADSGFVASGVIKVYNDAPIGADVVSVHDTLDLSPDVIASVDCGGAGPYNIAAGDSLTCTYTANVPSDGSGTNTATAHQQNYNYDDTGSPTPTGTTPYSDTENVVFDGSTAVTYVDASASLSDSTYAGDVSDLGTMPNGTDCGSEVDDVVTCQVQFESTFACSDEGLNPDVAYLLTDSTATELTDTARVYVDCYEISVAKNDTMRYTVSHIWDIDKSVTPDSIKIFDGDTHDAEWEVAIDDSSYSEDWRLSGKITISNPNPERAADLTAVVDSLDIFGEIGVTCGSSTVPASGSLDCYYDTGQLDSTSNPFGELNVATAHRQSYNFDKSGAATPTGTVPVSGNAAVNIADAIVTDTTSSVNVTDNNPASSAPWTANGDTMWTYSDEFACSTDAGSHKNIAEIVETGLKDSAEVYVDCYQLAVEKDAQTTLTENYSWTITKEQDTTWTMFTGDSATSHFVVSVTKSEAPSSDFMVDGNIRVINDTPLDAQVDSVTDKIEPGSAIAVSCGETFPYTLVAGDTLACTYTSTLGDDSDRDNIAFGYQKNFDYDKDGVGSPDGETVYSDTADVDFSDPIVLTGADSSATATDDLGTPGSSADDSMWTFGASGSQMYDKGFTCDDEGTTTNKVVLVGDDTGMRLDSATATVTVNCYDLVVSKDINPAYERYWDWMIDKSVNITDTLMLNAGEAYLDSAMYSILVSGEYLDTNYTVQGAVSVVNPAPIDADLTALGDTIQAGDMAVALNCEGSPSYPYTLAAGDTLKCTYGPFDLPDGVDRTNYATATLQNHAYHYTNPPADFGTSDYTAQADTGFANVVPTEYDECVTVSDTLAVPDELGSFCATVGDQDTTFTFKYLPEGELGFGSVDCDTLDIPNLASFVTNDTPLSGSDSALVTVEVVGCQTFGCTLTQGYWKTHNSSFPGGAPPDSTWLVLPDSENTVFFLSGKTWFEVFWEPVSGNAYYNLAHQYMAAVLNTYNNASTPPQGIIDAIAAAEDLFNTYAPEDLFTTWTNGGGKEKQKKDMELHHAFTNLAGILGSFNEGTYDSEWPHCDEDFLSSLTLQDAKAGKTDAANADEVSAEAADAAGEDAAAKTDAAEEIPTEFNIGNYPNPFNPTTTILVELPEDATVTITVYDALGRRVTSLMNKELKAGYHRVVWDAGNLPSGQYFYSLQSEKFQRTKKMLLLK